MKTSDKVSACNFKTKIALLFIFFVYNLHEAFNLHLFRIFQYYTSKNLWASKCIRMRWLLNWKQNCIHTYHRRNFVQLVTLSIESARASNCTRFGMQASLTMVEDLLCDILYISRKMPYHDFFLLKLTSVPTYFVVFMDV